jgi:hypothetical protein
MKMLNDIELLTRLEEGDIQRKVHGRREGVDPPLAQARFAESHLDGLWPAGLDALIDIAPASL